MRTIPIMAVLIGAGSAYGQFENFTGGANQGGWTFGGPNEFISPTGGNPNWYLRSAGLDTTIPWLRCEEGSIFTGDFRSRGVTTASIDVNVFETDFKIGSFPLTLILHSDNGTPTNFDDDWAVFKLGDSIPVPGTGWKRVNYALSAASPTLPVGWGYLQYGPNSPPAADWNAVITNVTRLEFSFGNPELFYIFQMWTVGADNIAVLQVSPPLCYANCDLSTGSPLLTANDFQCFINAFAASSSYANCDQSTGNPTLTGNDFQCFINAFAAGCS